MDPARTQAPGTERQEFVKVMDDRQRSRVTAVGEAGSVAPDLVRPSTLSSLAKDSILVRIVTGEIAAGRVYSALVLAGVLGVSATPVRETLLDLAAAGLAEAVPNKGFRIVDLTQDDLDEILQVRLMLEVPATAEIARRGSIPAMLGSGGQAGATAVVIDQLEAVLAEAGDIIQAVEAGQLRQESLVEIGQLLASPADPPGGVTIFKSVGIAAQDWALAELVVARARA
jgi:hypothetical protein